MSVIHKFAHPSLNWLVFRFNLCSFSYSTWTVNSTFSPRGAPSFSPRIEMFIVCVCVKGGFAVISNSIWAQCRPLCLTKVLLIEDQETAASYHPEQTGVLVRRICDVNAELHLLTRLTNLKPRSCHKGGGLTTTCFMIAKSSKEKFIWSQNSGSVFKKCRSNVIKMHFVHKVVVKCCKNAITQNTS